MKKYILFLLFVLSSCSQNCKELPGSYKNHEEAITIVLSTNFKYTNNCDVSESSFITSADYYSCDNKEGYLIAGINNKKYIYQNMPYEVWEGFKNAESKGKFYNHKIRGSYRLSLNNK
ncbi:KTSC domain-containing protein [Flavobacterium yafengii]|uniref:KTSC domain-containing protein n=1 Tax=Flavobacterium yafengii TaxID=3041253 RepID=UPI0024A91A10|nr:KTSC domain-containing protein [Flavobacterium yafengii]MDI5886536.1 KTSC domain-containing protein [Flavobacterium yafengii]